MRYLTAGESHGPCLTAIVEGVPAGLKISESQINTDLSRRQSGYGRGGRQRIERDTVEVVSGVRFGRTLGTPIALVVRNRDWENWTDRMATFGEAPSDLAREVTPRPGHADLVGALKTDTSDCRNILERASARETAARVAAAGIAREFLADLGVGGYATADDRLTSRLGAALFSIPAIKGVEFGLGFEAARRVGSEVHDPIALDKQVGFVRTSNNAGGLEGGMTTGMPLIVSAAMKPIPTLMTPLETVNLDTLEVEEASKERSDTCAVPACAVVAESEVAFVLAEAYLEKFGRDNMADIKAAVKAYRQRLRTMAR